MRKLLLPVAAVLAVLAVAGSASAATTLYNQNNNDAGVTFGGGWLSNVGGPQLADDFVVPASTSWHVTSVSTTGEDEGLTSVTVRIYSDSSGSPGTQVYTDTTSTFTDRHGPEFPKYSGGDLTIPINVTLRPGHYWLSVQGGGPNEWFWELRDVVSNDGAMYNDQCGGWTDLATCLDIGLTPGTLDLMFALNTGTPQNDNSQGNNNNQGEDQDN